MGFRRTIREPVLWDWATHSLSNYRCRRERHALWSRVGRVRFLLSLDTIDFDAQGGGGEMTLHGMGKPSPPQAGHFPENHHTVARHSLWIPVHPLAQNCLLSVGFFRDLVGPQLEAHTTILYNRTKHLQAHIGRNLGRPFSEQARGKGHQNHQRQGGGCSVSGAQGVAVGPLNESSQNFWATQLRSDPPAAPHTKALIS